MKTLILSFVSLVSCMICAEQAAAAAVEVLLVNDVSDEIQRIPWSQDLTLYNVMLKSDIVTGFTDRMYCISDGAIRKFTNFDSTTLKSITIKPGDIVIMGSLPESREAKLKQTPELGSILRALPAGGRP